MASFHEGMTKATYQAKQASRDIANSFNQMGGALEQVLGHFGSMGAVVGQALGQASSMVSGFAGSLGSIGGIAGAAAIGISAIGGAALAAGVAVSTFALEGGELAHNLELMSQKTGISTRDLQTFQAMGDVVHVSLDAMAIGMRKFDQAISGTGKSAGAARPILESLGVTSHNQKEALLQTFDAFSKMPDGPRKAADAVALFGRAGLGLIPILNQGREGFAKYEQMVNDFGPALGNAAEAEMKYHDSTEKLSLAFDKLKVSATPVLGILTKLTDVAGSTVKGLGQLVTGDLSFKNVGFNKGQNHAPIDAAATAVSEAKQKEAEAYDKLTDAAQHNYDVLKAGGPAEYALVKATQDIAAALASGTVEGINLAASIQKTIPGLEIQAKLEKQAAEAGMRLAESMKSITDKLKEETAMFGKSKVDIELYKLTLDGATYSQRQQILALEIGRQSIVDYAAMTKILTTQQKAGFDRSMADAIQQQGDAIEEVLPQMQALDTSALGFGGTTNPLVANSVKQVTDELQKEMDALHKVTDAEVLQKLQIEGASGAEILQVKNMQGELKKLELATSKVDTVWQQLATTMAKGMADAITSGKSMSLVFRDLGKQIEEAVIKEALLGSSGTGKGGFMTGGLLGSFNQATGNVLNGGQKGGSGGIIGDVLGLFGVHGSSGSAGTNPTGTANDPIYTVPSDTNGNPLTSLGGISGAGGAFSSLSALGGGLGQPSEPGGGFFGGIMSLLRFIPGLAEGGDVSPGRAYIVGEKQPELFVPGTSGRIVPNFAASPAQHQTTIQMHIHGVTDPDSFRKSQAQITGAMGNAVARANQRLGR